jgi:hypothetical protein
VLVSDNGTQFTSSEFKNFLNNHGVHHKLSAPYHPATNGQAERVVQIVKNKLKTLNVDDNNNNNLEIKLQNILLNYRQTPHATTKKSPCDLMLGRKMRSRLDLLKPKKDSNKYNETITVRKLNVGQRVVCREYVSNKTKWMFGKVKECLGKLHYIIQLDDGRCWKRHIDQVRKVGNDIPIQNENDYFWTFDFGDENSVNSNQGDTSPVEGEVRVDNIPSTHVQENLQEETEPQLRKSSRLRKAPERLNI